MSEPADSFRRLSREEYDEYLRDGLAFIERHREHLSPDTAAYWCETCRSFHPDTAVCVDGTWKAFKP